MRKTPLRKKSIQSISLIQNKIWDCCKQIVRKRYSKKNGKNDCYTCTAIDIQGSNCHTGHLWAKASLGAWLKYDLRVLRPQCYKCNIHHGGAGALFYARMVRENGQEYMNSLERERQVTVKAIDHYTQILEEYKKLCT